MKKALPLIITILLIGVAGYGVYLLANKSKKSDTTTPAATTPEATDETDDTTEDSTDDSDITEDTTDDEEDTSDDDTDTADDTEDSSEVEYEMAGEGDTAFTLSDLTAEEGDEENTYDVSVTVTTAGEDAEFEEGYTYKWSIAGAIAIENTRESVTEGEKTHLATLSSTRSNPTVKFIVEDPYTSKYVSIETSLQDLLGGTSE